MRKKRGPYKVRRHPVTQPSDPSYRIIPLTRGQNTLVDTADYEWLNQWNWYACYNRTSKSFYAERNADQTEGPPGSRQMAREILGCKTGEEADHIYHNTLDNRRNSLRKATDTQNTINRGIQSNNTSGYKGVVWDKNRKKWQSRIKHRGKDILLGRFSSPEEAARVRNEAAKKLHGEFAVLTFPHT